ncbi:hypothetical protein LUI62_20580 [Bradyrhizobium diazoefficiens]|nr:hypothetical protein [Bradyrhizobium diazoefficiens]MCD9813474.1 hypothetical protein [Bradyrhizobium diazoefficiens]MCD9830023.1 hypothetical protein [Bradyrhizobium diazoefficiens]MCD9850283.1 hypothetical protein [Bradyrhizobium diazoefficiens]MDC8018682.1 hypothetical protein [Bradyrhizobium diazoefficiens]UFW54357.1 hypothetical protein BdzoCB1809_22400 [Bradyrhizobium diazoefficiens]
MRKRRAYPPINEIEAGTGLGADLEGLIERNAARAALVIIPGLLLDLHQATERRLVHLPRFANPAQPVTDLVDFVRHVRRHDRLKRPVNSNIDM